MPKLKAPADKRGWYFDFDQKTFKKCNAGCMSCAYKPWNCQSCNPATHIQGEIEGNFVRPGTNIASLFNSEFGGGDLPLTNYTEEEVLGGPFSIYGVLDYRWVGIFYYL